MVSTTSCHLVVSCIVNHRNCSFERNNLKRRNILYNLLYFHTRASNQQPTKALNFQTHERTFFPLQARSTSAQLIGFGGKGENLFRIFVWFGPSWSALTVFFCSHCWRRERKFNSWLNFGEFVFSALWSKMKSSRPQLVGVWTMSRTENCASSWANNTHTHIYTHTECKLKAFSHVDGCYWLSLWACLLIPKKKRYPTLPYSTPLKCWRWCLFFFAPVLDWHGLGERGFG